jgi:hypothetical protein
MVTATIRVSRSGTFFHVNGQRQSLNIELIDHDGQTAAHQLTGLGIEGIVADLVKRQDLFYAYNNEHGYPAAAVFRREVARTRSGHPAFTLRPFRRTVKYNEVQRLCAPAAFSVKSSGLSKTTITCVHTFLPCATRGGFFRDA